MKTSPTFSPFGNDLFGEPIHAQTASPVAQKFLVPPFSVLSARDGDWQARKRAWAAMGIKSEVGRGELLIFDMRLERPTGIVRISEDGRPDWATRATTPFDAEHVSLEKLEVTEGQVTIEHAASGRTHRLTEINTTVSANTLAGPWRIDGSMRIDGALTDLNASTTKHGLMQKYPGTNSLLKGNGDWLVFPGTNSLLKGNGEGYVFPFTCSLSLFNGNDGWFVLPGTTCLL
mgnify:CR=1 FL=1